MRKIARNLRDYYNQKKAFFTKAIEIFHIVAFLLTLLVTALSIINLNYGHLLGEHILKLEIGKIIIESIITLYFFFYSFFRVIIPYFLDPMKKFYRTFESLKKEKTSTYINLPEHFSIHSVILDTEIQSIKNLSAEAWGKESVFLPSRNFLFEKWYAANKDTFSLIKYNEDNIGYICLLPVKSDMHFHSRINVHSIDENSIHNYSATASYVFVNGIYLKKKFQGNKALVYAIYMEFLKKFRLMSCHDYCILYCDAAYPSVRKHFSLNGFGYYKKNKHSNNFWYLPFENYKELTDKHPKYNDDYVLYKCRHKESQFFLKLYTLAGDVETNDSPSFQDIINHTFYPHPNLGNFFEETFVKDKNSQSILDKFAGKTLIFYTHSIYDKGKDKSNMKDHSLALSYIKFDNKIKQNHLACKFITATKVKDNLYEYNGLCFFSIGQKDIIFFFHPVRLHNLQESKAMPYPGYLGHSPVIISGRILKEDHNTLVENGEGLLQLHMITYSQHSRTTISKIGALSLKHQEIQQLSVTSMFQSLKIDEMDSPSLQAIKSLLLRSNKVVIKGLSKSVINNCNDVNEWFLRKFSILEKKLNIEFELYYYRLNQANECRVGKASLKFLQNGMAILNRNCYVEGYEGEIETKEEYYGEVNVRFNESGKEFVYIKLLELDPVHSESGNNSMSQNFRELFLILFWPRKNIGFDFTRGILLGDRDIDNFNKQVTISSSICALCNPNDYWKQKFYNYADERNLSEEKRISIIETEFLQKIIKANSLNKFSNETNNVEDHLDKILSNLSISFDDETMCNYKKHF